MVVTRIFISAVIVYGRHDFPSDARALSLTSFGKKVSSMRLNKAFTLFNFFAQVLLDDLNNYR